MIYAMLDNEELVFYEGQVDGAFRIEDDYKNHHLYFYDKVSKKIIQRIDVPYSLTVEDGRVYVLFETDADLYIKASFSKDDYMVSTVGYVYSTDGIGELELDVLVDGRVIIEIISERYSFDPILIESNDTIGDDPMPVLRVENKKVIVTPHPYYQMIQDIKTQVQNVFKGE